MFRHRWLNGTVFGPELFPDFHQPYGSGHRVAVFGSAVGTHSLSLNYKGCPHLSHQRLILKFLNVQSEDAKSYRSSKRDGGKGKPHRLLPFRA